MSAVDDALDDAGVVPQVDKGKMAPLLTPAGDPPAHADPLAGVVGAEPPAVAGAQPRARAGSRSGRWLLAGCHSLNL